MPPLVRRPHALSPLKRKRRSERAADGDRPRACQSGSVGEVVSHGAGQPGGGAKRALPALGAGWKDRLVTPSRRLEDDMADASIDELDRGCGQIPSSHKSLEELACGRGAQQPPQAQPRLSPRFRSATETIVHTTTTMATAQSQMRQPLQNAYADGMTRCKKNEAAFVDKVKERTREIVQKELKACGSVHELDLFLAQLRSKSKVVSLSAQTLTHIATAVQLPGDFGGHVWRHAFSQILSQEERHRRFALSRAFQMEDDQGNGERRSSGFGSEMSMRRSDTTFSMVREMTSLSNPGRSSSKQTTTQTTDGNRNLLQELSVEDEHSWSARTKRLRSTWSKIARGNRVHRDDMAKAIHLLRGLVGQPNPVWIEEVLSQLTRNTSVTWEQFVKFMDLYHQRSCEALREAFHDADADKSGFLDEDEVMQILKGLGNEKFLLACMKEADADKSGELSFEEFEVLLETIQASEGLTQEEREDLKELFDRFDRELTGQIPLRLVADMIKWTGYIVDQEELIAIARESDFNGSGFLELAEFYQTVSRAMEREQEVVERTLRAFDHDGSQRIHIQDIAQFLEAMHIIPNPDGIPEIVEQHFSGELDFGIEDLVMFLRVYRQTEGLPRDELDAIEQALDRYDVWGLGSIRTCELGKVFRWLGYKMTGPERQALVAKVDMLNSGRLTRKELKMIVRRHWENEVAKMRKAFHELASSSGESGLMEEGVKTAFEMLGYHDDTGFTPPIATAKYDSNGMVCLETFIEAGREHLQALRAALHDSGGLLENQILALESLFNRFDIDGDSTMSMVELGTLLHTMFPVVTAEVREQLDALSQEVATAGAHGSLDFDDFVLVFRQFFDIQAQALAAKQYLAQRETGFKSTEIDSFRELYEEAIGEEEEEDSGEEEQPLRDSVEFTWSKIFAGSHVVQRLALREVRKMVGRFCPLGDKNRGALTAAFDAALHWGAEAAAHEMPAAASLTGSRGLRGRGGAQQHSDRHRLDFAEFLVLMKKLIDMNFGNVLAFTPPGTKARSAVQEREANFQQVGMGRWRSRRKSFTIADFPWCAKPTNAEADSNRSSRSSRSRAGSKEASGEQEARKGSKFLALGHEAIHNRGSFSGGRSGSKQSVHWEGGERAADEQAAGEQRRASRSHLQVPGIRVSAPAPGCPTPPPAPTGHKGQRKSLFKYSTWTNGFPEQIGQPVRSRSFLAKANQSMQRPTSESPAADDAGKVMKLNPEEPTRDLLDGDPENGRKAGSRGGDRFAMAEAAVHFERSSSIGVTRPAQNEDAEDDYDDGCDSDA
eukprot:TRINITY_DN3192_c0_g2_i6.p1 TRINITY_DN3192_c0_g2~~TRINITY_DN3192_c0_g2_i6.p1  ORF type:complete len:1288 (-),score=301.35 TRINITY_DN3192_c0_g2_i6:281-4144(-)